MPTLQEKRISRLRHLLTRTPYWTRGHLELARLAGAENDNDSAFAAVQAVLALSSSSRTTFEAQRILARISLKRGSLAEAKNILSKLRSQCPDSKEVVEDFAATLILEGKFPEALKELQGIPPHRLSAEGKAALNFVLSKESTPRSQ